jgi:hypothetical protein
MATPRRNHQLVQKETMASLQFDLFRARRLMHMPTLENATRGSIGQQLGIGDGEAQWTVHFAERLPEVEDVAVDEKGRGVKGVREEGSVLEVDSTAFVGVFEDAGGEIAEESGERLVAGAAGRFF